jgi:GTP-binding protein Era
LEQPSTPSLFRSGFVAIAGPPNAGKSTLLNRMLGEKISITSSKPQTTRNRILGVLTRPASQLIFLDTPGVHHTRHVFNLRIVEAALGALNDADVALLVVDAETPDPEAENFLVSKLDQVRRPVILAVNKVDRVKKTILLQMMESWQDKYDFREIVPVSAKLGTQVDNLIDTMEKYLPQGTPLFPEDTLTDMPMRFIAAEMIREKVFRLTGEEIPYSTAVTIDVFQEEKKGARYRIEATIHVERNSQKGIVIGKGGTKLKQIGTSSRKSIEKMLGAGVFLKLFVRVQKNWSRDTRALRKFGY